MVDFSRYINPIIKDVKQISDIDDKHSNYFEFPKDIDYLITLIKLLSKDIDIQHNKVLILQKELEELKFLIESFTGDDKNESIADYNSTFKTATRVIGDLNRLLDQISSPYFGRITFERRANKEIPAGKVISYIGKNAYFDKETNRALVTDWRAPIANLYYMNQGPTKNVSFQTPVGLQEGDLTEKTQFDISMGRINSVYESQTGNATADAFLLSQLSKKIGKKLTDIVSTIQDQQNKIIRDEINKPMIIQGVAGSGKTTILLHRIAYLLYGYKDQISTENSLIIAPSKMFLDYISEILPSLGVDQIHRNTYLYWCKSILNWDDRNLISTLPDDLEVKTFKSSTLFIRLIEKFVKDFEKDLFDKINDPIKNQIATRYYDLEKLHPNLSINEKLELAVKYAFAQIQFTNKTTGNFFGDLDKNNKREKDVLDYIRRRVSALKLYKELFQFEYIFKEFDIDKKLVEKVRSQSLNILQTNGNISYYKIEDLAPLVWLHFKLFGTHDYQRDYIAIDEAQDMSPFQLLTLAKVAKNQNITIAGDLAQAIIEPFYLSDWQEITLLFKEYFNCEVNFHQLDKCYRTTVEIIEFANKIISNRFPSTYKLPEAVLRHGNSVSIVTLQEELWKLTENSEDEEKFLNLLEYENQIGFATLAILCRNSKHSDAVYNSLSKLQTKIKRNVFNYSEEDYHEGIIVLPIEKAKGLEFDSVIVADFNDENFKNTFLDAKLFYVAATRALHRLHIIENKNKSKLLEH